MSENLKVSAVNTNSTINPADSAKNKGKKNLINHEFTTTEKVIGGLSALTLLGIGIYAAVKKGKSPKKIKPNEPEIKTPHTEPQPEVKPTKPEPAAEKPIKKEVEEIVEKTFSEQKADLVKTAISIEDFKQIGKFKNDKAILNNGEPFTGQVLTKVKNGKKLDTNQLWEYKDGVLQEGTTLRIFPSGRIEPFENYKYENGKLIERMFFNNEEPYQIAKYFKNLDNNRVEEIFRINGDGTLKFKKRITYTGTNTISEFYTENNTLIKIREKNGVTRAFIENRETGDITPLENKFEEIFKDPDGVPKYKIFHGYDGEGQPFQYVEIYGKDGKTPVIHSNEHNMSFEVKVPKGQKQDDIMYNRATYDIEKDEINITHTGSMGLFEDFDVTSKGNIITIKDRHFHGGVNSPDVKVGTYNIETGEINCDQFFEKDLDYAPKFSEQIKGIIERLYGSEKPVPVKQLYEQKMSIVNDLLNNKELKPERVEIPWEL
jgi:hypothetical protein